MTKFLSNKWVISTCAVTCTCIHVYIVYVCTICFTVLLYMYTTCTLCFHSHVHVHVITYVLHVFTCRLFKELGPIKTRFESSSSDTWLNWRVSVYTMHIHVHEERHLRQWKMKNESSSTYTWLHVQIMDKNCQILSS